MPGTLDQVAQKAGVSSRTVTRILRGDIKEIWPSTIARASQVRAIAQELGYRPNSSASAMRRGKFDCVGLLLSSDRGRSHLPATLLDAVHDALAERGMHLSVARLPDERLTQQGVFPRILSEWCCDGLLINYTDRIPQAMQLLLNDERVPSLWLNSKQPADCVYYHDEEGSAHATQRLLALGHKRILYVDFIDFAAQPNAHYSRRDRHAGYVRAIIAAGLTPSGRESMTGIPVAERLNWLVTLLRSPDRPTAILSYDAPDRVLYAAAVAHVRVPQDLSIISFAEQRPPYASNLGEAFMGRAISLMRVPTADAGKSAIDTLLQKISQPSRKLPPCVLPLVYDAGDTCGPIQGSPS